MLCTGLRQRLLLTDSLGEASEVRRSGTRQSILDTLCGAHNLMSPDEIALASGLARNVVHKRLADMLRDAEVIQFGRGKILSSDERPQVPETGGCVPPSVMSLFSYVIDLVIGGPSV